MQRAIDVNESGDSSGGIKRELGPQTEGVNKRSRA